MPPLPTRFVPVIVAFAPLFRSRITASLSR
jgi:hypothetical protein